MDAEVQTQRHSLFAAAVFAFAVALPLPRLLHFRVEPELYWLSFVMVAVLAIFIPYAVWRKMNSLQAVLEATAIGILVIPSVLIMTYAALRFRMPLADQMLIAADHALGFHWPDYVHAVDSSRLVSRILGICYGTFSLQLLFLPTLLGLTGRPARAYQFMLIYLVLCMLASLVSIAFPSAGAYQGFGVDAEALLHIHANFGGRAFVEGFHLARDNPDFILGSGNAAGIISFPSVHAGAATLCAWAMWPSRRLRYPFLLLNALMAIAAITHGAHYLVDIFAGMAVAAISIVLVTRARLPRVGRFAPAAASAGAS